MKYLKKFEANYEKKYWKLPVHNLTLFKLSLDNIGVDEHSKDMFISLFLHKEFDNTKYILIGYNSQTNYWGCNLPDSYYYTNNDYEYMGKVNISDEEENQYKYNL